MTFVWSPNKGESEASYMQRMFDEHPTMSVREILRVRNSPIANPVLAERPVIKEPPPRNNERELELEREIASLRLQNNQLKQRLEMFQHLIREYQNG